MSIVKYFKNYILGYRYTLKVCTLHFLKNCIYVLITFFHLLPSPPTYPYLTTLPNTYSVCLSFNGKKSKQRTNKIYQSKTKFHQKRKQTSNNKTE